MMYYDEYIGKDLEVRHGSVRITGKCIGLGTIYVEDKVVPVAILQLPEPLTKEVEGGILQVDTIVVRLA